MKFVISSSKILKHYLKSKSGAKFAALDVGTTNVGVAVVDETRLFFDPLPVIVRKEGAKRMTEKAIQKFSTALNEVVRTHQIDVIIVGLPIYEQKLTPLCHEIIEMMNQVQITAKESTVCVFWDESHSTAAAKSFTAMRTTSKSRFLKEKDGLAASYLLRNFLKSNNAAGKWSTAE